MNKLECYCYLKLSAIQLYCDSEKESNHMLGIPKPPQRFKSMFFIKLKSLFCYRRYFFTRHRSQISMC